jgi:GntR family transcriptional regulator
MRTDSVPTPLYHQIYVGLRGEILGGRYAKGDRLPSENNLTERFGVARVTIRSAMSRLESEGLVARMPGRGTICLYEAAPPSVSEPIRGMIENLIAMGFETTVSLLESAYLEADAEVAKKLSCNLGARVHRAVRVRYHQGRPFSYLTTFLQGEVADRADMGKLGSRPLLVLLEESGEVINEADQWISACAATTEVARALDVDEGAPLISLTRVVYARQRRAVEFLHALYRPDMYVISNTLARQQGRRRDSG